MLEKNIVITKGYIRADFNFWVGKYMDKFYDGLEKQKIIANECPKCKKVYLPPRQTCGECFQIIDLEGNWKELPGTGTLINFTTAMYSVSEAKTKRKKKPVLVGLIQMDGSDGAVVYEIMDAEEKDLKAGMKMEIVWNKKITGNPNDIKGFKPAGGA